MILNRWKLVIPSLVLIYFGYSIGGFFKINYLIGGVGVLLGAYQIVKYKKKK